MIVAEILSRVRSQFLDDGRGPQNWTDGDLFDLLGDTIAELCEDAWILDDSSTPEICVIPVVAGTSRYLLDQRVLNIQTAILASSAKPLGKRTKIQLDPNWRNRPAAKPDIFCTDLDAGYIHILDKPLSSDTLYLSVTRLPVKGMGMTGIDITLDAATKQLRKPSGRLDEEFAPKDVLKIIGADREIFVSVASVTSPTVLVVNEDIDDLEITLGSLVKIINMSAVPEIKETYHNEIFDGILWRAYSKQDADTYDPKKAATHLGLWKRTISDIKIKTIKAQGGNETFGPGQAFS